MEHGWDCNCEDCWWAREQELICPTCGCLESSCPCSDRNENEEEGEIR